MADNSSGVSAIVAIVAIIAIGIILYFGIQMLGVEQNDSDIEVDLPEDVDVSPDSDAEANPAY
ncbi:MAG TPA: hypothetical protein VI913_01155 [Candidatus Peribacteraceae bacterium]|nr:hypothetical protein [Candidatus Peribacteraceae bacterium]